MKKFKLFLFIGCLLCLHADTRAGLHLKTDSIDCISKKKQYDDLIIMGNFKDAFPVWRNVFTACPGHSKSIYSDGIQLYERKIGEEKDPGIKSALTDTLLKIYDQQIQYFGEEGMVTGQKGIAMHQFASQKKNEINLLLKKSVEIEGSKSKAEVLEISFDVNKELYLDKKITRENLIDVFHNFSLLNDTNRFHPDSAKYNNTQKKMDAYISSIVNCNDLVEMYSPYMKSNPNDINQLRKIVHLFNLKECYDEDIYLEASQTLYRMQPTAPSAVGLAKYYIARDQTAKAGNYFNEAFDLESDIDKKALLLIEISQIYFSNFKNYSQAKAYALRAASLKPGWGQPYLTLGDIYAASMSQCEDEFNGAPALWAATDKYMQAKSLDPSFADQAQKKIEAVSKKFPAKDIVFKLGMKAGDTYVIKCWIHETTTIRTKK